MKSNSKTIFTLESRENGYLEVTKEYFKLTDEQMYAVIQQAFVSFVKSLEINKNIDYNKLRNALTPNINKKEIALIFNSSKVDSAWYGYDIFDKIIPLFNKKTRHSILTGDLIINSDYHFWREQFFKELISKKDINFLYVDNCYIVYINNLSKSLFEKLDSKLQFYEAYVGYLDITFQTPLKSYLSSILCRVGILNETTVILPGEDDDWTNDNNTQGLPFDKNGFIIKSVPNLYFDLFLSYKIERRVFEGYEFDIQMSLNTISPVITNLEDCKMVINPEKLSYLKNSKTEKLKNIGLLSANTSEIEELIRSKISDNYIYEMTYLDEFNVMKFNCIIETTSNDNKLIKSQVTLKYNSNKKILEVITFI